MQQVRRRGDRQELGESLDDAEQRRAEACSGHEAAYDARALRCGFALRAGCCGRLTPARPTPARAPPRASAAAAPDRDRGAMNTLE